MLLTAGGGNAGWRSGTRFQLILVAVVMCAMMLAARGSWAVQSCEDCGQCMTNCVCQADGSCEGTPLPSTQGCDDGNPCSTGDHCSGVDGRCVGSGYAGTQTQCDDHNDCTTGDHCDGAGSCTHEGTKETCTLGSSLCTGTCVVYGSYAVCMPDCGLDFCHQCDPNTGECTLNLCSFASCSTGQCDAEGLCIPGHEGETCNDGDVCTSDDRCQDGACEGSAGSTPPPPGTATPTPIATPIPGQCVGDCNGNDFVSVDEILTGVNIALGNLNVSACDSFDVNGDGMVTVDEILAAVNAALNGCPEVQATPTPGGSTPSIGTRAAGMIESTTSAFLVIPNLLSALLGHLPGAGSGSAATNIFTLPFTCSSGGGTVACDQTIVIFPPSLGPPTYTVTLNNCQISGSTGTLTFNGTLTATGQDTDSCGSIPANVTLTIPNLTVQTPTGTATFTNFNAGVSLSCSAGSCDCYADTVELHPTGTIAVASTNATSQVTFGSGSSILISVDTYNTQCVPTIYDMQVDGNITLTTNGNAFEATYSAYNIYDDASSGQDMVTIDGDVDSPCFGDTVGFSTYADIVLGNPCPSDGVVDVYAYTSFTVDEITYSSGGVHIDFDDGNSADYQSCLDPQLFACPAG
jgi:hypothetical protein